MRLWNRQSDLEDEIGAHFRMAVEDGIARGLTPQQARLAARREFGGEALAREMTRETWRFHWFSQLASDLRYGARILRKSPGFTAVVILTLALGIGANTAIYSLLHAALTPIPIPQPDRVVMVWSDYAARGWHGFPASLPDFQDWRSSGVFSALAATMDSGANLRWQGRAERVSSLQVSADFWKVAAVGPQLGRLFTPEEFTEAQSRVVVLSNKLWQSTFSADPSIVGRTVVLDGAPCTVVGILGKDFPKLGQEQIYTPLVMAPDAAADRGSRSLIVVGRLPAGLSLDAAGSRMSQLAARLGRQYTDDSGITVRLQPLEEANGEDSQTLLTVLLAAVGFVLLIACANLAGLTLARSTARVREMTVRAALGAGTARLVRQLLTENLLLAVLGSFAAVVPAWLVIRLIRSFPVESLPDAALIGFNWNVLAFNFGLALFTGILFGLAPAWQTRKLNVSDALKASGRGNSGAPHQRLRSLLVSGEIALTLVLVTGASLAVGSFWRLQSSSPGFDARQVVSMRIALADRQYSEPARQSEFFEAVLGRVRALPGVTAAGASDELPFGDSIHGAGFIPLDRPEPRREDELVALYNSVTPGYFEAMRVPLVEGRRFDSRDRSGAQRVALVDRWTSAHFWPGRSPLGQHFRLSGEGKSDFEIVGVVGDIDPPAILKLRASRFAQAYFPMAQKPLPAMSLALRTSGDPAAAIPAVRDVVHAQDADQPVFLVRRMEDIVAQGRMPEKLAACLLGSFALVALLLAAVGVYGVMAYSVSRRWREFGIRMSLGAQPGQVRRMVLRQGTVLALAGIAVGLLGAFLLTRAMGSLLYRVGASDPLTFAVATALLAGVALAAAYLPAHRATRVDPVAAVREE